MRSESIRRVLALPFLSAMFGFHGIQAQNIKFEHYNDKDGLSHNSVRHIVQDDKGFLWLGTFSGLNRFDGYEFKSYNSSSNDLHNDDITALELNKATDQLWIGTRNGLTRFDMDTHDLTTFLPDAKDPYSLPDHEIRSVHIDRFNRTWVGTKNKGLFLYDAEQNRFKKIDIPNFNYIKEIFEDSKGSIWIGSYKTAGVAKITFDEIGSIQAIEAFDLAVPTTQEINPFINFIYEDEKSDIFVGSRKGLYKLDKAKNEFENLYIEDATIREKIGSHFTAIARAPDGKYWLGTLGGIVVTEQLEFIENEKVSLYYSELSDDDSIVDDLISALYFDASGVLWVGTEEGFDKYDPFENQFKTHKEISKYIDNQVPRIRGFSKTYDDKLIVATRHNGLFILDNEQYSPLFDDKKDIASIHTFDGKTFYCGLWQGEVLVYDYETGLSKIFDIGFNKSPILSFAKLGENKMIVGSHGEGAVAVELRTFQAQQIPGTSNVDNAINKVVVDPKGKIWFATQSGVFRHDPFSEQTKSYGTHKENDLGLLHENVSGMTIDTSGKIWAATRNGLNYYDDNVDNFISLDVPHELQDRWITDVVADSKDDLWLNMNNNRIAKYQSDSGKFKMYHVNNGNRLDIFSLSGFYYDEDSHIYLGGKDGVLSFSPKNLKDNSLAPAPVITNVSVQNQDIKVGSIVNGQRLLEQEINTQRKLVLNNANKNFAFTFSSPSYVNERLNKYSYILEGFDESWNTVDVKQRTVQYTNLFFGTYTFKVKAMNSHGAWSEASTYQISILPPFWLTYKAWFLVLLILSMLFYLARRQLKIRSKLKQELLLEKVQREREEKLNNEKLRFFTNISHELRTPLTLILGPVKQLIEENIETGNQFKKRKLDLIHHNTNRLLKLVNQVLDFRKAKSGELKLKVSMTDILVHTKNTFDSFLELADDKKIQFNLVSETDNVKGYLDRDTYDKILYNLLSNAFKFTDRYGTIDLSIRLDIQAERIFLIVDVGDNGIGIPKASQEKIFTRFYQSKNGKENNTGSGIGLSLVKALVDLHKGAIVVKSASGQGSLFSFKIPIDRKAYYDDEVFEHGQYQIIEESPQVITAKKIIQESSFKERILIVEDHTELRTYLVDYLSQSYKVFEAKNGQDALQLCTQLKPVLCVADVMMPVMNGLQFCNALKNDSEISHIPVLLLTALSACEDKIKGYTSGADGYLVKPFEPSLLKTRIENMIKSRKALQTKFSKDIESEVGLITHSPVDEEFMTGINSIIQKNIGNVNLGPNFLCTELGMSSSKLYRKIKEITNLAPNEFIRTVRLKKSAQLLKTKKYNVSEVTDHVGFNDPLYFSRCFKKQFGYPPSQLIK